MLSLVASRNSGRTKRGSRTLSRRGRTQRRSAPPVEALEERQLLSGLSLTASTFSLQQFETNLREQVGIDPNPLLNDEDPDVIGVSYAISQRNATGTELDARSDGLGLRRMPWDTNLGPGVGLPASPDARVEIASISKMYSGVGLLKLLQDQAEDVPGMTLYEEVDAALDQNVTTFLPVNWNPSQAFLNADLTLRDLLQHRTGLRLANLPAVPPTLPPGAGAYTWQALRNLTQNYGTANWPAYAKTYSYHTTNFAYLREVLPFVWDGVNNSELNNNAVTGILNVENLSDDDELADALAEAIIDDWGPVTVPGTTLLQVTPDRVTATIYRYIISNFVLEPSGIDDAQTQSSGQPNNTLLYPLNLSVTPGTDLYPPAIPQIPGVPGRETGDQRRNAGSRGWFQNAFEVNSFLAGARYNDEILHPQVRQLMDDQLLGWLNSSGLDGDFPQENFGHDGVNFRPGLPAWAPANAPLLSPRNNTGAVAFANNVQATMLINSQVSVDDASDEVIGMAFDPAGNGNSLLVSMVDAWDHAWTDLVYNGDNFSDGSSNANDVFHVRRNPTNPNDFIDFRHDGSTIFTRRIDTLDSLTIFGLGGNDTLYVEDLPDGVEVVFYGLSGDDEAHVGRGPGTPPEDGDLDRIQGEFTFHGGTSDTGDTLIVDDRADFYLTEQTSPGQKVRTYTVTNDDVRRSEVGTVANYTTVEDVILSSSNQSNRIRVFSTAGATDVEINAGLGDDDIVLGNLNASGNLDGGVDVNPGAGNDRLIIDDRNGAFADDFYVFQDDFFQSMHIPVIEWDAVAPPERIVLRGSNLDSTTNIQGVVDDVRLTVSARGGDDTINLHSASADARVTLLGGLDNDTIALTPTGMDLDPIEARVFVRGGFGTFDQLVGHDASNAAGGRRYRFNTLADYNRFDVVGSPFGRVSYDGTVETFEVQGGDDDDDFDVRESATSTLISAFGNGGSDTFDVTAAGQDLDAISGPLYFSGGNGDGVDVVTLNDQLDFGNDNYSLQTAPPATVSKTGGFALSHLGVEELTLNANEYDNSIVIGGAWALQSTHYTFNAGDGADSITVNASAPMRVTVNGDAGFPDHLLVRGTLQDDVVTVTGNEIALGGTTVIPGDGLERRTLNPGGGLDLLSAIGVPDVSERFIANASTTAGSGFFVAAPHQSFAFENLEDVEAHGNAEDRDRLRFRGTAEDDSFDVNPLAAGTATAPVVRLHDGAGTTLLKLRDFSEVGLPHIVGLTGFDTFRVTLFPGRGEYVRRDMRLDGSDPLPVDPGDPPRPGDTLILTYDDDAFTLLPNSTIGPHNGRLRFADDDDVLNLLYRNFEYLEGDLDGLA